MIVLNIHVCTKEGEPGYSKLPESGDTGNILEDWWMLVDEGAPEIKLKQLNIFGTLEFDVDSKVDHVIQAEMIFISGGRWLSMIYIIMKYLKCKQLKTLK